MRSLMRAGTARSGFASVTDMRRSAGVLRMKEKDGEHPQGDAGQIVLRIIFLAVWITDFFVLKRTTSLAAVFPLSIRLFILAITAVVAARLIITGHRTLDHGGRPAGVITSGAFRHVRHPLYLESMLI